MKKLFIILSLLLSSTATAGVNYLPGFILINAGNMVGNLTSGAVDVRNLNSAGFEFIVTGTPTGSFFVDCTVMPNTVTQTWVQLTLSPAPTVAGSAVNLYSEVNNTNCAYMRVRYVVTSGTGTVTVWATGKTI